MSGFVLFFLVIIIRYGIVSILGTDVAKRTAFFPPTKGIEKIALWIYEVTILSMMVILIFTKIKLNDTINFIGLGIFISGMILYLVSIVQFAKPEKNGLSIKGLYKISRNPMYVAFFFYFLGCSLLTESLLLLFTLVIFQISVHYLILSEERWCIKEFGEAYKSYMNQVRRYL